MAAGPQLVEGSTAATPGLGHKPFRRPCPRALTYAATKAYVQTFAEGIRRELSSHGVDVIASAPGPVLTGFANRAPMRMTVGLGPGDIPSAALAALGRRTTVRPGWLSKALDWSLALLPRWGRVPAIEQVMRRMSPDLR